MQASTLPEVVRPQSGLEVYCGPHNYQDAIPPYSQHKIAELPTEKELPDRPDQRDANAKLILGFRRRTFWFGLLGVVLITGAIIGGLSGAIAAQKARWASQAGTAATPSPSLSSTSQAVNTTCPSPTINSFSGESYKCTENIGLAGHDVKALNATSLQYCIDVCSSINLSKENGTCIAAVLGWNARKIGGAKTTSNCWLKGDKDAEGVDTSDPEFVQVTVALLQG